MRPVIFLDEFAIWTSIWACASSNAKPPSPRPLRAEQLARPAGQWGLSSPNETSLKTARRWGTGHHRTARGGYNRQSAVLKSYFTDLMQHRFLFRRTTWPTPPAFSRRVPAVERAKSLPKLSTPLPPLPTPPLLHTRESIQSARATTPPQTPPPHPIAPQLPQTPSARDPAPSPSAHPSPLLRISSPSRFLFTHQLVTDVPLKGQPLSRRLSSALVVAAIIRFGISIPTAGTHRRGSLYISLRYVVGELQTMVRRPDLWGIETTWNLALQWAEYCRVVAAHPKYSSAIRRTVGPGTLTPYACTIFLTDRGVPRSPSRPYDRLQ